MNILSILLTSLFPILIQISDSVQLFTEPLPPSNLPFWSAIERLRDREGGWLVVVNGITLENIWQIMPSHKSPQKYYNPPLDFLFPIPLFISSFRCHPSATRILQPVMFRFAWRRCRTNPPGPMRLPLPRKGSCLLAKNWQMWQENARCRGILHGIHKGNCFFFRLPGSLNPF
jgi:hypothetical protein